MSFGTNGPPENLILVSPFHKKNPTHEYKPSHFYAFLRKATLQSQLANRGTFIFITGKLNKLKESF